MLSGVTQETGADPWCGDRHGVAVRRLVLAGAAVLTALLGALLGAVPSAIEPGGEWVECGPALFHDWNRLPYPGCAASYEPFQSAAIALLVIAAGLVVAVPFQRGSRTSVNQRRRP